MTSLRTTPIWMGTLGNIMKTLSGKASRKNLEKFLFIAIWLSTNLQADVIRSYKRHPKRGTLTMKKPFIEERPIEVSNYSNNSFIPVIDTQRDTDHFLSLQLANSYNGYGMYIGSTNPIAFVPGKGIIAAYRMMDPKSDSQNYILFFNLVKTILLISI